MRTPNGIRTESNRTPKASRAGALYATQRYLYTIPVVALVCGVSSYSFHPSNGELGDGWQ
jgi:hypothetical protein